MSHTILLAQIDARPETKLFNQYENEYDCLVSLCRVYKMHLINENPNASKISYSLLDLFKFLDKLKYLACFVFEESTATYKLCHKAWMKDKLQEIINSSRRSC